MTICSQQTHTHACTHTCMHAHTLIVQTDRGEWTVLIVETFGKDNHLELVFEGRENCLMSQMRLFQSLAAFSFGMVDCAVVSQRQAVPSFLPVRFTSDVDVSEAVQVV